LEDLPQPFGRLDECPKCSRDLHVCRMCEFFDPRVANACREPIADEVKEKERSNFCDYFQAKPNAHEPPATNEAEGARVQLEALFGRGIDEADSTQNAKPNESEKAQSELNRLFGLDDDDGVNR
jgi:hypothetical protein